MITAKTAPARSLLLAAGAQAALVACASAAPSPAPSAVAAPQVSAALQASPAHEDMPRRHEVYAHDYEALNRFYPLGATPARAERLAQRAADELAALDAVDFDALDLDGKVDHVLLRHKAEREVAERAEEAARIARLQPFLAFAAPIVAMDDARRRAGAVEARAAAAELVALATQVGEIAERVTNGDAEEKAPDVTEDAAPLALSPVDALWLAPRVSALRRALDEWYRHHADYNPGFAWWCEAPKGALAEALDAYARALREDVAGQGGEDDDPMVGDPIGREALVRDLASEMIAYSPEEMLAIGRRELAWCRAEMVRAADEMGLAGDWRAALERVKEQHVEPGEQDRLVAEQAAEVVRWLDERDLVTIPALCRETWRVRMIPEDEQRFFPFMYYGGNEVDVAYPTAAMDHEAKRMAMRGNNVAFSRAVTPHELIPGHHLQGFMERRHASHRRGMRTPFLIEGWALYWEMREYDLGWARTPEERVGMLFWRMHRAARIVVSLGFHLGEMSTDEMVELLIEEVGHERDNATAEVRRYVGGNYGPLYQCAYMIGGIQLIALHQELVVNGALTEREFHDAILRCGPIPIEMIRALMTGEAPARDHAATWRFDDGGAGR